ncbi:hypothetical protein ILYODFUR_037517 [Ilyodon furcidens]|uniref:Uncharacterized protein n=1 Tax=Ilyodon furcidens TaxID=33524 RepID=A0ABV0VNA2_9TELE
MSQKFIMLFLVFNPRVVSLDPVAKILIGEDHIADQDRTSSRVSTGPKICIICLNVALLNLLTVSFVNVFIFCLWLDSRGLLDHVFAAKVRLCTTTCFKA